MRSRFSKDVRLGVVISNDSPERTQRFNSLRKASVSIRCSITSPAKIRSKLWSSNGRRSRLRSQYLASMLRSQATSTCARSISTPAHYHPLLCQCAAQSPVEHPISSMRPTGSRSMIRAHFFSRLSRSSQVKRVALLYSLIVRAVLVPTIKL